jgi:hypothetical protein
MSKLPNSESFAAVRALAFVVAIIVLGALAGVVPKELRIGVFIAIAVVLFRLATFLGRRERNKPKV